MVRPVTVKVATPTIREQPESIHAFGRTVPGEIATSVTCKPEDMPDGTKTQPVRSLIKRRSMASFSENGTRLTLPERTFTPSLLKVS